MKSLLSCKLLSDMTQKRENLAAAEPPICTSLEAKTPSKFMLISDVFRPIKKNPTIS